ALLDAGHFVAKGRYLAAELVSGNQRRMDAVLRPAIPVVNVQVGAADGGDLDLDQDVGAPEGGDLYFANICARSSLRLDYRQHRSSHDCLPMNWMRKTARNPKRMILAPQAIYSRHGPGETTNVLPGQPFWLVIRLQKVKG